MSRARYVASYVRAHSDPDYRLESTPWIFAVVTTSQALVMTLGGKAELALGSRGRPGCTGSAERQFWRGFRTQALVAAVSRST